MNVVVFVPIGILLEIGFAKWPWLKAIGTGCSLSMLIEAMQLGFKRGVCEVDDVMHNTLGRFVGYMVARGQSVLLKD